MNSSDTRNYTTEQNNIKYTNMAFRFDLDPARKPTRFGEVSQLSCLIITENNCDFVVKYLKCLLTGQVT